MLEVLIRSTGACALTAALVWGCGDALAPTALQGEELFRIEELFNGEIGVRRLPERMRLGLFWAPDLTRYQPEEGQEHLSIALPEAFPDTYTFQIFEPVPEALYLDGHGFALGRSVVYEDANANGRHDPGEPLLAARNRQALLFAPRDIPAEESPFGLSIPAGYHDVSLPLGHTTPDEVSRGTCGVLVGAPCSTTDACGRGVCYRMLMATLPGGMCIKEITAEDDCVPAGARVVPAVGNARRRLGVEGWALPACEADADCLREDYVCDPGQGVCRSFTRKGPINSDPALPFLADQYTPMTNVPAGRLEAGR